MIGILRNSISWLRSDNLKSKSGPAAEKRPRRPKRAGLVALALTLSLAEGVATAQSQKIYKIGRLSAGAPTDPLSKATYEAFQDGLRELGWIEGKNVVIDNRWGAATSEGAVNLAAELVRLNVDVIVAVGSPMI